MAKIFCCQSLRRSPKISPGIPSNPQRKGPHTSSSIDNVFDHASPSVAFMGFDYKGSAYKKTVF